MTATASSLLSPASSAFRPRLPIDLNNAAVARDCYRHFDWLLENDPVHRGKVSLVRAWFVSRYDDCETVLKDKERFTRNRARAKGKEGKGAYPVPKALRHLVSSLVNTDDPDHKRLRDLVHKAFTPRAIGHIQQRIDALCGSLLDDLVRHDEVDLISSYTHPIPVKVISEMMGVGEGDIDLFVKGASFVSGGFGLNLLKALAWDLPKLDRLVRKMIDHKRQNPSDDILSGLVHAELEGDRLTEDEVVGLAFVLTFAGFETTVYLIANTVLMLLLHPEQKALALSDDSLLDGAIEETLRFHGSVQGTEVMYALEDVTLSGVTIPKGDALFPLLGAANRDPRHFDNPHIFDVTRTPNRHLGFGLGIHYCVGAPLARMETKLAVKRLFERAPHLSLAVDAEALELQPTPFMRRYKSLPIRLR